MSEHTPEGQEGFIALKALNHRLKEIVEARTQGKPVQVWGLVTNVHRTRSGHVHLKLRQGKYGLACVVFRSVARGLPFWITDGQTLRVRGQIEALEAAFRQSISRPAVRAELNRMRREELTGLALVDALSRLYRAYGMSISPAERPEAGDANDELVRILCSEAGTE